MASDGKCLGRPNFQGFSLSLNAANDAEAERFVRCPGRRRAGADADGQNLFSSRFGMVADRFGVSWMVIVARSRPRLRSRGDRVMRPGEELNPQTGHDGPRHRQAGWRGSGRRCATTSAAKADGVLVFVKTLADVDAKCGYPPRRRCEGGPPGVDRVPEPRSAPEQTSTATCFGNTFSEQGIQGVRRVSI